MKHVLLTIVGLTVLFAGTANALMTTTFDDVEAEVNLRLDNLPTEDLTKDQKKEKNSLEKALKSFAKDSTSSKKDAKLIGKIVKTLSKQYPEDKAMATLLNDAMDAFHAEFYAGKAEADDHYGYLTDENKKKNAATKKKGKVEEKDGEFGAATDLIDKSKLLKKVESGLTAYDKANGKALKKEDTLTNHERAFLVEVEGGYQGAASCMECHEDAGTHMLQAGHWNWEGVTANVPGHETEVHGKNDVINNFCIAIPSNEPRCTQCHPGYGYKDNTFDFANAEALDCLVCHDTTGTYKKDPKKAGAPVEGTDLMNVAMNAGAPSRQNCGSCHFYAGGGDNVKKGDLGSSLVSPTKAMDVHMGSDGQDFSCQACHETVDHKIPGNQLQDSGRVDCQDCHGTTELPMPTGTVHNTTHLGKVACQTCHIPTFSRQLPTKVWWDWSLAGDKERVPVNDENGMPDYNFMKGEFVWAKDVAPTLMWYNGTWSKTFIGVNDTWGGMGVFNLGAPQGANGDGKIYPFKKMEGVQPADAGNGTILVPHLFPSNADDTDAYWKGYDWNNALSAGAAIAGQTYSGSYTWVQTEMYLSINHEVAPKEDARSCGDCHGVNSTFPWTDLGLTDPMPTFGQ